LTLAGTAGKIVFLRPGSHDMTLVTNRLVERVQLPPIPKAWGWIEGVHFPESRPLLDVCQAVPSYPPPDDLREHMAQRVRDASTAVYTDIGGLVELRAALADDIAERYGARIAPDDVMIMAGCNQAFWNTMVALAGHGDQVLLPSPWYFNHDMSLRMLGVDVVPLPFRAERGGVPDPDEARALVGPRTRAIVLVTPNNPTGAVYPPDVLAAFYELARETGCALVIDETYRDFLPGETAPHGLFLDSDWGDTLVHLYSFSKVYCLTGYRVGTIATGAKLRNALTKVTDCVQICAPHIGQEAALYGLRHLDSWRRDNQIMMADRAGALRRAFQRNDLAYDLVSAGAYFGYVRHPFGDEPSEDVARRLAVEHGLLCLPGSWFGPDQEAYLRFAFANLDEAAMPAVAERLVESQG
jgi:aspartate/methionine/tyrosine aminotransferase